MCAQRWAIRARSLRPRNFTAGRKEVINGKFLVQGEGGPICPAKRPFCPFSAYRIGLDPLCQELYVVARKTPVYYSVARWRSGLKVCEAQPSRYGDICAIRRESLGE